MRRWGSALVRAMFIVTAGCHRNPNILKLHYIPQFVPGSRAIFAPTQISVAQMGGLAIRFDRSAHTVGTVSDEDGNVTADLFVSDLTPLVSDALIAALTDAGLKPGLISDRLEAHIVDLKPAAGTDFLLSCDLTRIEVNKRFGPQRTVHGQVFTMRAFVEMACALRDRTGHQVFAATVNGDEEEPPKPVGDEAFLPLETDPAESLSVAISRAIGDLILQLKSHAALTVSSVPH